MKLPRKNIKERDYVCLSACSSYCPFLSFFFLASDFHLYESWKIPSLLLSLALPPYNFHFQQSVFFTLHSQPPSSSPFICCPTFMSQFFLHLFPVPNTPYLLITHFTPAHHIRYFYTIRISCIFHFWISEFCTASLSLSPSSKVFTLHSFFISLQFPFPHVYFPLPLPSSHPPSISLQPNPSPARLSHNQISSTTLTIQ